MALTVTAVATAANSQTKRRMAEQPTSSTGTDDTALEARPIGIPEGPAQKRHGFWWKLWRVITAPWRIKWVRYTILILVVGGVGTVAGIPKARYYVLNAYGATVSSSITITDDVTHQPLKNVTVHIAQSSGRTDDKGTVVLRGLRLGPTQLAISRPGFGAINRDITLGWGSNPLGTLALRAVGMRYTFMLRDYLTNKGVSGVQVTSGDAAAVSDKNGKAVLTVPGTKEVAIHADVIRDGYRTESVVAQPVEAPTEVSLVTSRRAVYMSKERGTYDIYAIDADGKNKQLLVGATGLETGNNSLAVSPDGTQAALVSTRDNQRDATGTLLNALTLVDTRTGDTVSIAHATQVRLLDWSGTRLVFEQSATDAGGIVRHTVYSYDYASNTRLQLAQAKKFGSVMTVRGLLYYAVPADPQDLSVDAGYFSIRLDGSGKQTVLEKDVWTAYRTDYNKLSLQTSDGWYASNIDSGSNTFSGPPVTFSSRIYIENPVRQAQSIWADMQNGQGILLVHGRQAGKDIEVYKKAGLAGPLRWLTEDTAIFRVVTATETADYAVSTLGGGTAHKLADVVNTYGFAAGQ